MNSKQQRTLDRMVQPEALRTDAYKHWHRGKGTDVWAMICAVITGDLDTVKALIARDPGLADCEYEYFTPLRFAVRENQHAIIDYLLQHNVQEEDAARITLVEIARDRGYTDLAYFLEERRHLLYNIVPEGDLIANTIKSFDIPAVCQLLDERPELVHAADAGGNKPIHWAALTRQMQVIDELLKRGADINVRRPDRARALDLTFGDYDYRSWYRDLPPIGLRKHEVVIGYLIARGADYDISVAAKIGDYQRVKQLLDEDPSLIRKHPEHIGYYCGVPLRAAAAGGHKIVVQLLLDRGANVNEPEPRIAPWGGALHAALGSRQYEVAKLLVEHGADVNATVESSGNVLSMAKWSNAPQEIIDLLVAHGAKLSDELIGYEGDVGTLSKELEANPGKDVSWILDHAIGKEFRPMLDLILQYHPNALKERKTDSRAWWDNQVPKDPAFVRRMLELGLDPNRRNWLGITMLHRCANQGNQEIAEVLLEFGADINAIETEWGSTPLGWAVREGRKDMAAFLLEKGADPNAPGDEPWAQPIAWAKRKQNEELIALLHYYTSNHN